MNCYWFGSFVRYFFQLVLLLNTDFNCCSSFVNFNIQRQVLFDKIATIDANILTENEDSIVNTLLFGKPNSENSFNKAMLNKSNKSIFYYFVSNNQGYLIHTSGTLFSVCLFYLI